jgi:hypothetical protein
MYPGPASNGAPPENKLKAVLLHQICAVLCITLAGIQMRNLQVHRIYSNCQFL